MNNSLEVSGCKSHTCRGISLVSAFAMIGYSWDMGTAYALLPAFRSTKLCWFLTWLAIPFIPHCQSALCSLPPVLIPNCNNCWTPQLTLIPPQQCSCHFSSASPCPFWFFYSAFLVHHFFSSVAFTHFLNVWLINWPFRYNNGKEDDFLCTALPITERQACSLKLWLLSPVAYLFGGLIQGWFTDGLLSILKIWMSEFSFRLSSIITLVNTGRIYS